jgi:hypothetical protein
MTGINRPLTEHERELVRWLLEHATISSNHLLEEIPRLGVVGTCSWGYPTTIFARYGEEKSDKRPDGLSGDYLAYSENQLVGVMLFASDSEIIMLEAYSMSGSDKPFGLPAAESLFPWEELSTGQSLPTGSPS